MVLTKELIDYAEKEVNLSQYYEKSREITANHILFKQFIEGTRWKSLPKIVYYILMEKAFRAAFLKDSKGDLGYALKLVENASAL